MKAICIGLAPSIVSQPPSEMIRHDRGGRDQEHDDQEAGELGRRLAPVRVLDDHLVVVGHDGATIALSPSGLRRSG